MCVLQIKTVLSLSTRRHPAHPDAALLAVSVLILHPTITNINRHVPGTTLSVVAKMRHRYHRNTTKYQL